jgi:hypothetical protein
VRLSCAEPWTPEQQARLARLGQLVQQQYAAEPDRLHGSTKRPTTTTVRWALPTCLSRAGLGRSAFGVGQHGINLDQRILRQGSHANNPACRGGSGEEAGVHAVHGGDVVDVLQVDIHLHHIGQRMLDAFRNGLDVLQAQRGLLADITSHQLAAAGFQRQLGRNVVVVREGHGLAGNAALRGIAGIGCLDDDAVAVFHCLRRRAVAMGYHGFNLHQCIQRQAGNGNGGAGREIGGGTGNGGIREEGGVYRVHGSGIGQVFQEDIDFHDVVKRDINAVQNGLDVLQALRGLFFHAASHQFAGCGSIGSWAEILL